MRREIYKIELRVKDLKKNIFISFFFQIKMSTQKMIEGYHRIENIFQ
jgi:hypothetical protein